VILISMIMDRIWIFGFFFHLQFKIWFINCGR